MHHVGVPLGSSNFLHPGATAKSWCRYSGSIITYKSMERDASGAIRELHAECHPAPEGQKPPKVLASFPHVRAACCTAQAPLREGASRDCAVSV